MFHKNKNSKPPKWLKWLFSTFWNQLRLLSFKIRVEGKLLNFHTVQKKSTFIVWKLMNFSYIQFLRETIFNKFRIPNNANFRFSEALKLAILCIYAWFQGSIFHKLKQSKLYLLRLKSLFSRKIWMAENIFSTLYFWYKYARPPKINITWNIKGWKNLLTLLTWTQ